MWRGREWSRFAFEGDNVVLHRAGEVVGMDMLLGTSPPSLQAFNEVVDIA